MKKPLALVLPLLLMSCAENPTFIGISDYDASYTPGEFQLYGQIQAFTRGSPYPGLAPDAAQSAVLADMQQGGFNNTNFTTATVGRSPYRVLMVFAPTQGTDLQQLCEIDATKLASLPAAPPPTNGRIGLAAVFCRSNLLLGGAEGTMPVAMAADDPAARGSIQAFMRQIFPATNPAEGGGAGSDPP